MPALWVVTGICFLVGAIATSRWLPELREGTGGLVALFVICGLSGAALAAAGLHIDLIVRTLESGGELGAKEYQVFAVARELTSLLLDSGVLVGLAVIAYLLAPKPRPTA
jgi:hypothetical protein